MKRIHFFISTLLLVTTCFLPNGFAQDYVHYATLTGHTDGIFNAVTSVAFSPNGLTLASGSSDWTIRLWDVATGHHKKTLAGHTDSLYGVAFSPDGLTLASGSHDATIRLWDVVIGQHKKTLAGHTDTDSIYGSVFSGYGMAFSPDGLTLASGSRDSTIWLWDVATGQHKKTLTGCMNTVQGISFSPDGLMLASWSFHTICLWDFTTGKHKTTLHGHTGSVYEVSFSPDGLMLASGGEDKTIRLWDVVTGHHKKTLIGHTGSVMSVSFSPDGLMLASGGEDKTIRLWDVVTGHHKKTLIGHTDSLNSVAFSPDGLTLASGSRDDTIRLWRVDSAQPIDLNPQLTANQVYKNAIRAVMWIVNPGIGEGSGVLIEKKSKLAVTNAHVTGSQNTIDVFFPAPDKNGDGELIVDRNFYLTNVDVLKQLGYYTKGHVVARNEKTDLAIIKLDGLPETAREIDWNFTQPTTKAGELVYILGNPAKHDLWRWTLGEFLKDYGNFLHIQSDVFGGNSGGPILNRQGILIGIVARSDRLMNALAIPVRNINELLSGSQLQHSRPHR